MVRREEGKAMVELAITLSLLLVILLGGDGIWPLGPHTYLVVTHAAQEGARVAALGLQQHHSDRTVT